MPPKLPPEKVREIVDFWLRGDLTMAQIAVKAGVKGKSTVSKVIEDERRRSPDLDSLRSLSKQLTDEGVTLLDAARAANVLSQIKASGVELGTEGIKDALEFVRRYGDKVQEAIDTLSEVRALEEKEKKPFEQIGSVTKALQATLEDLRRNISDLETQVKAREERLGSVREYELLKTGLDDLAIGPQAVNGFVMFHKQLVTLGFTQDYATAFATALDIRKLLPKDAAEVLAQALRNYASLDQAVRELEGQKSKLEAGIRPSRRRRRRSRPT